MEAAWEDVVVVAGITFEKVVELQDDTGSPRDLSSYTGLFVIRDSPDDSEVLAEGDVVCTSAGLVTATIPAAETAVMDWYAGRYDLTIAAGARVEPVLQGRATLTRSVSR